MQTTIQNTLNGLDLEQLTSTVEAIKNNPSLAHFEFRNKNQWIRGGTNRSTIQGFYGAGREDDSRDEPFVFMNGEPPVLLGNNEGANPVEFLLHALAGCVTSTFVIHAAARGIKVKRLSTTMEGTIDLQGFLNLDESVPAGYKSIEILLDVDADCTEEELQDLLDYTRGHSPVCNTVCRPVPVSIKRV